MTSRGPSARTPEEFVERLRDIVTANAEGGRNSSPDWATSCEVFLRSCATSAPETGPTRRRC